VYNYMFTVWSTAWWRQWRAITVTPMLTDTEARSAVAPFASLRSLHAPRAGALEIRVLGEVEAVSRCGTFAPGRARPGALLAMLVIHAGECVPVDRLVDELWSAESPARGAKRVQVNVLRLRRGLAQVAPEVEPGALIRTRSHGYSLEIDPDSLDAARFARLIARGRSELDCGDPARGAATLREALALWRGRPYGGYAYESFAAPEIRRLEELRTWGLEAWAEAELALGAHATMVPELERLVTRHPLCERLHALLMIALYRCRRQSEALAAYHRARAALVDGLGLEPGSELRALQSAILGQCPSLELGAGFAPVAPAPPRLFAQAA
jgi:DNA-binding SARP family transcriptional activator